MYSHSSSSWCPWVHLVNEKGPWSICWVLGRSARLHTCKGFLKIRSAVLPTLLWRHCLFWYASTYCDKPLTEINMGKKGFILLTGETLWLIAAEAWTQSRSLRQDLKQRLWRNCTYWLFTLNLPATFVIESISTEPGMVLFSLGWAILHHLATIKMPHRHNHRLVRWRRLFNCCSFF